MTSPAPHLGPPQRRRVIHLTAIAMAAMIADAAASPSLAELLAAGRQRDPKNAVAAAQAEQAAATAALARAARWPTVTVRGGYTRNQHESQVPMGGSSLTIVPLDQVDATATVVAPLFDLATWRASDAAAAERDAAAADAAAVSRDGDRAIVRSYFAWVGGAASVAAAESARAAATANLALVQRRLDAQLASPLDVARAQAAVADADATRAAAELVVTTARRQLATATGVTVDTPPPLPTTADAELPLDHWLSTAAAQPEVEAAAARVRAAAARTAASRAAYLPSIALNASERWTNAPGFGEALSASVGVTATWRFGLDLGRRVAVDRSGERGAAARLHQARTLGTDRIADAWDRVAARRAAVSAAQARVDAARLASSIADQRFAAGTATQLDVTLAQRDALTAELALVSARAELAADRALLRLAAGREVAP